MGLLDQLPERGWGVVRATFPVVLAYQMAGLIKAQRCPQPDTWQARLTGAGRELRNAEGPRP